MSLGYYSTTIELTLCISVRQLFLLITMLAPLYQSAAADSAQDSSVKAALALNFARFTEWPTSALKKDDSTIQLCVIGDNVTQQAFVEIDRKQVGTRWLKVVHMPRIKNIEQCHLLYISALDRNTTIQLLLESNRLPILLIGEDEQHFLEDGGMVVLSLVEGKVSLQINLKVVKLAGLQISSRVLKLATIVNP
jgi:hypothetical protein